MLLNDLAISTSYNTSTDELIKSFYEPALTASVQYDRGVGYFTSNWLKMASAGLSNFAARGGTARFIVSPHMSAKDWAACKQGLDAQHSEALLESLRQVVSDLPNSLEERTLSTLAWMIADGILDLRIAVPTGDLDGDFHDKFGAFRDEEENVVAFHGSMNDSAKAFRNYESISVFYSWVDEREANRVQEYQQRFVKIWENSDPNVRVFDLPASIKRNLVRFTEATGRPYKAPGLSSPSIDDKWRHQGDALKAFLDKKNGVLEMATGTGKTKTAIAIIKELLERDLVDTIIITMSGKDLLQQWYRNLIQSVELGIYQQHGKFKEVGEFLSAPAGKVLLIARQQLAAALPNVPEAAWGTTLLIADEVHGLGSPTMVRDLSGIFSRFRYRLGLSATPEREYDELGTKFIEDFEFGLEKAIERGILCEFDYTPLDYALSTEDRADIKSAFARHHARASRGEVSSEEILYREIALIRKTSLTKLPPFEEHVEANRDLYERCLIFVETTKFGQHVQKILMAQNIDYHTYYQADNSKILVEFGAGDFDCLISCHRLSEGIDIQSVRNIVLFASARSELETTQRLGRCLRSDPKNPAKRAHVLDFVDLGDDDDETKGSEADLERQSRLAMLSKVKRSMVGNIVK